MRSDQLTVSQKCRLTAFCTSLGHGQLGALEHVIQTADGIIEGTDNYDPNHPQNLIVLDPSTHHNHYAGFLMPEHSNSVKEYWKNYQPRNMVCCSK